MKKSNSWLLVCAAVLFGLVCLLPVQAEAAPVEWHTTNLYYEVTEDNTPENILIIDGYFRNNTGRYINYVYEFNLTATITDDSGYTGTVKGTFRDFEKMLEPYGEANHRFRIRNADIIWPVDSYEVRGGYMRWKHSSAAG
ncbi:hypothetical protein [Sporomusa sphaeroides]|uniref:Uncharacterized protein n=2 Tax=Sporomusa TaxID=2375 RepID=A0ABP2C2G2_9FIRM|nr:hypothetical protein [Sporomusa sphaeroides]OLS56757.1 hypothetical protein SPSPH_02470 [Sporomusa sphaeroides DSM 2875]CVK18704.1 hypothetical protein SSPH_01348 [Sporomusa sphaeroides DSM 2875]SCM81980.1 conserved exported hypothetical protein [uncultured Sporomusa sp.]